MPRIKKERLLSLSLLVLGLISLAFSVAYTFYILAFIGLGLTFWGALLLYITTEKYVKQALLDSSIVSALSNLNQILTELRYKGGALYLPPKYFKDSETVKVYLPKFNSTELPRPEDIQQQEEEVFLNNPEAALLIPPGLALSKLFEKRLGTSFTKVDLEYLQKNLPKLFIEDLEIVEDLDIEIENDEVAEKLTESSAIPQKRKSVIRVKISNSVYNDLFKGVERLPHVRRMIGCPISSAIACAIAKASANPVIIEKIQASEDGKTNEAYYGIVEKAAEDA